jgi:hypothetical protein
MAVIKPLKPASLLCLDIEIAVAKYFGYRQHVIVPNISWGLGFLHEIDVLVMTKSGYCTEIEIKTTRSDLKRDLLKTHQHESSKIRQHFLAVPRRLADLGLETFPKHWGILSIDEESRFVEKRREAIRNKEARALSLPEIHHLYELASMRTWSLKETLSSRINRQKMKQPTQAGRE